MAQIIDQAQNRTHVYDIVAEFPDNYIVWAIGRHNFEHDGYIPLAETLEAYRINENTLKAIKVEDEEFALIVLEEAVRRGVDKKKFERMKKNFYSKAL